MLTCARVQYWGNIRDYVTTGAHNRILSVDPNCHWLWFMFCRISDHLLLCIQIIKSDFQRRNSLILLLELVQFISVINSRIRMGPSIKQGYRCQPSVLCGFTCGRKDYQIPNHIVMILSSDYLFLFLRIYSRFVKLAAIFSQIFQVYFFSDIVWLSLTIGFYNRFESTPSAQLV